MEITGYDYVIYSTKSIFSIEEKIKERLREMVWSDYLVVDMERREGEYLFLFFAKDQRMKDDDIGYTLDKNGEGCFSIIGEKVPNKDLIVANLDEKREITHDMRFVLNDIWGYGLVLPEYIEDSPFVGKVYQAVIDVLSEGHKVSEEETLPIQKPCQYFTRPKPIIAAYSPENE